MPFPTAITGLQARYRSADLTATDGSAITSWGDAAAGTYPATQSVAGRQPTVQTVTANGKAFKVARFDGAATVLITPAMTLGPEFTVIAVGTVRAGASYPAGLAGHESGGGGTRVLQLRYSNSSTAEMIGFTGAGNPVFDTQPSSAEAWHVHTAVRDDSGGLAGAEVYVDGASAGGSSPTTDPRSASHPLVLGACTGSANNADLSGFGLVDLAEVLVFTRALSSTERAQVHSYLQDTYGVTVADYVPSGGDETVNAGADQVDVEPWSTVTLAAASSATTVAWSQLTGPTVTLTPSALSATFTAPPDLAGAALTFRATAGTATDDISVTVLPATDALMTAGGLVPIRLRRGAALV